MKEDLENRINKLQKYTLKTETGYWYNPEKIIEEIKDLRVTKKAIQIATTTKEFYQFTKEEVKEDYFIDDAITSVSSQLFWVNWLQIGIQKIAGINQKTVDTNFVLTTIAGVLFGYLYSTYRDFKAQNANRAVKNKLEKETKKYKLKNWFKKHNETSYWNQLPKKSTIKRTVMEGSFLASWHFMESMARYRLMGETNSDKLVSAGIIYSIYGFIVGNLYAYTIDLTRHIMGIDKSKKDIDNIFETYHEVPIKQNVRFKPLKRAAIIALATGSVYLSYLAKDTHHKKIHEKQIQYQKNENAMKNKTYFLSTYRSSSKEKNK